MNNTTPAGLLGLGLISLSTFAQQTSSDNSNPDPLEQITVISSGISQSMNELRSFRGVTLTCLHALRALKTNNFAFRTLPGIPSTEEARAVGTEAPLLYELLCEL